MRVPIVPIKFKLKRIVLFLGEKDNSKRTVALPAGAVTAEKRGILWSEAACLQLGRRCLKNQVSSQRRTGL